MRKRSLGVTLVAAVLSVSLVVPVATGAIPKQGKYVGKTATSGKKIVMTVKPQRKATVKFCNYSMGTKVARNGSFTARHVGAGGTYVAVKGKFVTRRKAKGTVTVDYLCDTQGEKFTLRRK